MASCNKAILFYFTPKIKNYKSGFLDTLFLTKGIFLFSKNDNTYIHIHMCVCVCVCIVGFSGTILTVGRYIDIKPKILSFLTSQD